MEGGCYMPNNPAHYGLPETAPGSAAMGRLPEIYSSQYWQPDDMGSFSLPPLDLEPLFPFSPTSNYKNDFPLIKDRPVGGGDMADVLLSLKHPIVHNGQLSPTAFTCGGSPQCQGPGASLSYTVHPQMLSMSPGGGYGTSYCSAPGMDQSGMFTSISGGNVPQHNVNVFPSMSVNVSMNMTMHGYPAAMSTDNIHSQVTCPQVQWGATAPNMSPVYGQTQSLLSPQSYNNGASTTYSFTADFRSQPMTPLQPEPQINLNSTFKSAANKPITRRCSGTNFSANITASASASACFHTTNVKLSPTSDDESQQPNLCRICGKTYARPSTLKTHLRTHSGEKPYRCDECNKSFSQAANLTAHVRTHSGEKPFRCPICDRRFSQSSSVTTHMRTHSGERPYRCRMCKKAFSDSSTLTKHLRIHSGEKPYQCKLCLLRFSQSGNLNRHMRVHGTTLAT